MDGSRGQEIPVSDMGPVLSEIADNFSFLQIKNKYPVDSTLKNIFANFISILHLKHKQSV